MTGFAEMKEERRAVAAAAADLRARSEKLRFVADSLDAQAERLEVIVSGGADKQVLRGRALVDVLVGLIEVDEEMHYRDMDRRLLSVGYSLDRLAIEQGGPVRFACRDHPRVQTTAIYQDGDLRLLCPACGFERARIKVALAGEEG